MTYFYPRPPRGGRRAFQSASVQVLVDFYPRPPRGGRHLYGADFVGPVVISIHALREEGDTGVSALKRKPAHFYPRPPRGGRRSAGTGTRHRSSISIHALREEGDLNAALGHCQSHLISIHALREEGDFCHAQTFFSAFRFLSTPSARRATLLKKILAKRFKFLSTPSARRATAKTETKSLFSNKLYNILHEFRRALIYNGSKNYPNHAK